MSYTKLDTKKLFIFVGAIVFIIIIIALVAGGKKETKEEDKPTEAKVIQGEQLAEVKEYGGLEISDVKFEVEDNMTEVTANVLNNTEKDLESQYVNINILDKNGSVIADVGGFIDGIEAGGTGKMIGSFLTSEATSNAYNVEITDKTPQEPSNVNNEEATGESNSQSDNTTI